MRFPNFKKKVSVWVYPFIALQLAGAKQLSVVEDEEWKVMYRSERSKTTSHPFSTKLRRSCIYAMEEKQMGIDFFLKSSNREAKIRSRNTHAQAQPTICPAGRGITHSKKREPEKNSNAYKCKNNFDSKIFLTVWVQKKPKT